MEKERRLSKIDFIFLFVFTFLYALLSFHQLGSFDNPNTFVSNKKVLLEIEEQEVSKIRYFTGHKMGEVKISVSLDGKNYSYLDSVKNVYAFTWNDIEIDKKVRYIRFEIDKESNIGEIALYDTFLDIIKIQSCDREAQVLIDEQNTVPKEISYFNSAYFDEIYFARTAYEYANGLPAYEWVHPPLGKIIMSIPISLFKMAPFYYRLMGNIAGVLMIPILYIFAKRMFKKTKYGLLAGMFIAMDNFHFAHTRIATVDSFLVLFILLSFLFMYEYFLLDKSFFYKKIMRLFLSGFFIGCAICIKWTALFAALALAILFFIHFYFSYFKNNKMKTEGYKILGFCFVFFVFIPIFLYILFYLCFSNMEYYQTRNIKEIMNITTSMYQYHSSLKDPHPFYSSFYTWPFMLHPVWYYARVVGNVKSTISGFGNPILWWFSTFSILYLFYKAFKKDKDAFLLLIIYECMVFPYLSITRGMFLYHYFPMLPFTFLALVLLVRDVTSKIKNNYFYLTILILVSFFFFYFFPIVSGMKSTVAEIQERKWISSWHF